MMIGEFGEYLQILRQSKGITVRQLGEMVTVSSSHISNIENGRRKPPKVEVLKSIVRALGLTEDEERQLIFLAENERKNSDIMIKLTEENWEQIIGILKKEQ
ncbi:MAG: helix-turn-helix domain-containing protein [Clostridia bacterium]|nr:helix-turn-helix domain-containing protein [Clostridia bacterium]